MEAGMSPWHVVAPDGTILRGESRRFLPWVVLVCHDGKWRVESRHVDQSHAAEMCDSIMHHTPCDIARAHVSQP
jgi:hypothetical protein